MNFFDQILENVHKIPYGRVATYGQIAALSGSPRGARMVGWALHQAADFEGKKIPWHRVINRQGMISITCLEHLAEDQAYLLKKEGIKVEYTGGNYSVDLKKYLWKP